MLTQDPPQLWPFDDTRSAVLDGIDRPRSQAYSRKNNVREQPAGLLRTVWPSGATIRRSPKFRGCDAGNAAEEPTEVREVIEAHFVCDIHDSVGGVLESAFGSLESGLPNDVAVGNPSLSEPTLEGAPMQACHGRRFIHLRHSLVQIGPQQLLERGNQIRTMIPNDS